jgi:hypothetical protein
MERRASPTRGGRTSSLRRQITRGRRTIDVIHASTDGPRRGDPLSEIDQIARSARRDGVLGRK